MDGERCAARWIVGVPTGFEKTTTDLSRPHAGVVVEDLKIREIIGHHRCVVCARQQV